MIAKTFCTYKANSLRAEKGLRDHGGAWRLGGRFGREMRSSDLQAAGGMCTGGGMAGCEITERVALDVNVSTDRWVTWDAAHV